MYREGEMKSSGKSSESLNWEEIRDFVVDQVKHVGRQIDSDWLRSHFAESGHNIDGMVDRLVRRGYLVSSDSNHPESPGGKPPAMFAAFQRYRKKIEKRFGRAGTGFRVHLSVYAGVNLFLLMIWALTGAGFPWFLFPVAGWGIGLANHLNSVIQRYRQRREVAILPDLTEPETRYLQKMHSVRAGFGAHTATTLSVTGFLALTNLITGGGFPWFLIPSGGLALSLFIHYSSYAPKIRQMRLVIKDWLQGRRKHSESEQEFGRDPKIVQEAHAIQRSILKQAEGVVADGLTVGDDFNALLDTYVEQIRSLAYKQDEMDRLIAEIPTTGLQKDRAILIQRRTRAESEAVRNEYDKSIAEVDQQLASIKELGNSREVLELRLRSAMNIMKQLQLDLARVKGMAMTNTASFELLKNKSNELSSYIGDLETGYSEIESESTR